MDATTDIQPDSELFAVLTYAETEADRVLESGSPAPLDAIVWLSAHLAAFDRAVAPKLKRVRPDGGVLLRRQRAVAERMSRLLRIAERHHSGDALAAGLNPSRMGTALRRLIDEHVAVEAAIVDRMAQTLDRSACDEVVAAYRSALEHAPTRPHPHFAHGAVTFRVDALRDRMLDAMDGRHVPVPRVPRRWRVPGRWGSYLLGQPQSPPE
ncbi:MAG TPA: hypothetical protein VG708_06795 [Mycobacteriales bacterium]|nr:hypothetical protein [Mycobacteriales bacterium]